MVSKVSLNPVLVDVLNMSMSNDHVEIMKKLSKPKHDEDIAGELGIKATIVRTLLNDLHAKGLVEYDRMKNKKTGWYTYLWMKREDKVDEYLDGYLQETLEELNSQLESEKDTAFFGCSCSKVAMGRAMELNFMCPECNGAFTEFNNNKTVRQLNGQIAKINRILKKKKK